MKKWNKKFEIELILEFLQYLNFVASTIAITLFQPAPKKRPFESFDDMANAVLDGNIKLVGIKNAATARFTSPSLELAQSDATLMKFLKANEAGKVDAVPTMPDAFNLIRKEENRAFIVNVFSAYGATDLCDYEIITDSTFPRVPYGFFYSNMAPQWLQQDAAQMSQLQEFFLHFSKNYMFPKRCVRWHPRIGLDLSQVATTIYMMATGIVVSFTAQI